MFVIFIHSWDIIKSKSDLLYPKGLFFMLFSNLFPSLTDSYYSFC